MKKNKIIVSLFVSFAIVFSLSGCTFELKPFDKLIQPPKLSGKYQVLQETFETYVKSEYTLVTPENGEYQSSFILKDIDNDGNDDAIIFYSDKEANNKIQFCFFRYEKDKWNPVCKNEGLGNSIDRVYINDLNDDGICELIIGWGLFDSKTNKTFAVYNLWTNKFQSVSSYQYSYFNVFDVDGNGIDDIFTLYSSTSADELSSAYARVYTFDNRTTTLNLSGETPTDGNISSYNKVTVQKQDSINYIYIDAVKGADDMITEVVYWDEENSNLVSPLLDSQTQSVKSTLRHSKLNCFDVDGDKIIEIPVDVEMNGSSVSENGNGFNFGTSQDGSNEKPINYTKWVKFNQDSLESVQYSIVNMNANYMLNIQSSWVGRITVKGDKNEWNFYRWDNSLSDVGDLLFSIYSYVKTDTESQKKYSNYKILKNSGKNVYVYNITDAGYAFGVKDDTIVSNLNSSFSN